MFAGRGAKVNVGSICGSNAGSICGNDGEIDVAGRRRGGTAAAIQEAVQRNAGSVSLGWASDGLLSTHSLSTT